MNFAKAKTKASKTKKMPQYCSVDNIMVKTVLQLKSYMDSFNIFE